MNLPPPSIDMCDGAAATWIEQLADLYTWTDANHVRGLAARLRRQHDAAIKAEADARAKKIKGLEDQLLDVEDRRRHLASDEDEATRELEKLRST